MDPGIHLLDPPPLVVPVPFSGSLGSPNILPHWPNQLDRRLPGVGITAYTSPMENHDPPERIRKLS